MTIACVRFRLVRSLRLHLKNKTNPSFFSFFFFSSTLKRWLSPLAFVYCSPFPSSHARPSPATCSVTFALVVAVPARCEERATSANRQKRSRSCAQSAALRHPCRSSVPQLVPVQHVAAAVAHSIGVSLLTRMCIIRRRAVRQRQGQGGRDARGPRRARCHPGAHGCHGGGVSGRGRGPVPLAVDPT